MPKYGYVVTIDARKPMVVQWDHFAMRLGALFADPSIRIVQVEPLAGTRSVAVREGDEVWWCDEAMNRIGQLRTDGTWPKFDKGIAGRPANEDPVLEGAEEDCVLARAEAILEAKGIKVAKGHPYGRRKSPSRLSQDEIIRLRRLLE